MKKNNTLKLTLFFSTSFLFAVLFNCVFGVTVHASEFILLYSNDIHGEIEPCG